MPASLAASMVVLAATCCIGSCKGGSITGNAGADAALLKTDDAALIVKLDTSVSILLDAPAKHDTRVTCQDPNGCGIPPHCGDGTLDNDEECDDGNTNSGDGCTMACRVETDFACPNPGAACVSTVVCGDGHIAGKEACDDHNTNSGDGCSGDCSRVETGWVCVAPGVRCQPKCGDGLMTGWEECDDGNTASGDGCT